MTVSQVPVQETAFRMARLLLATDGSPSAKPAQEFALALAAQFRVPLALVSVVEFELWRDLEYGVNQLYLEDRRREVRELLDTVSKAATAARISSMVHDPVGPPAQEILAVAAVRQSDLIVVGTHGRTGVDHVLIGSTAERVLRAAPCPVVTVKGVDGEGVGRASAPASLRHLMVAVDFSDCSIKALEYAGLLAKVCGSRLTLLHVVEPVAYGLDFTLSHALTGTALRDDRLRSMAELGEVVARLGLEAVQDVIPGVPADVIPRLAAHRGCDAIVLGTHGRRGWSHLRFGSVAEAVVRQATCPVFVVRHPQGQPPDGEQGPAHRQAPSDAIGTSG